MKPGASLARQRWESEAGIRQRVNAQARKLQRWAATLPVPLSDEHIAILVAAARSRSTVDGAR